MPQRSGRECHHPRSVRSGARTSARLAPLASHTVLWSEKLELAPLLEILRRRGLKIIPRCDFVRAYIERHPNDRDMLA